MTRLHLDFETYCDHDIRKVGRTRYVNHPSFRVILTALAVDDGPVEQWEGIPASLPARLEGKELHAFNATFERAVLARYGIRPPVEAWRCTMAHAYSRGFSGGLADVGAQVGVPQDRQKLMDGNRLIGWFCSPSKRGPAWTEADHPEQWGRFKEYNVQDVIAEREVYYRLREYPMTPDELKLMWWDWSVNERGLPVDLRLSDNAIAAAKRFQQSFNKEAKTLCGLSLSQAGALLAWARKNGYPFDNLRADTIRGFLEGEK
jgi:DNA polymerase